MINLGHSFVCLVQEINVGMINVDHSSFLVGVEIDVGQKTSCFLHSAWRFLTNTLHNMKWSSSIKDNKTLFSSTYYLNFQDVILGMSPKRIG